jgi:hypothetical protein
MVAPLPGAHSWNQCIAMAESSRASDPSPLHRNFVQRCLRDRSYDVIGWK